jgi:hypothetical protein
VGSGCGKWLWEVIVGSGCGLIYGYCSIHHLPEVTEENDETFVQDNLCSNWNRSGGSPEYDPDAL